MKGLGAIDDASWLSNFTWIQDPVFLRVAIGIGVWLGGLLLIYLLVKSVSYRVTETHLVIHLLWIPVRRISIREIRHMGTEHQGFSERWYNTFRPARTRLVIHRKRGWPSRILIITPKNTFVMMHDLQQAKDRLKAAEAGTKSRQE